MNMPTSFIRLTLLCLVTWAAGCGGRHPAPDAALDAPLDLPGDDGATADRTSDIASTESASVDGAPAGDTSSDASSEAWSDTSALPDGAADVVEAAPLSPRYHAIAIAAASLHVCALLDDHRVKCWGDNSMGQLGLGDTKTRGNDHAEMGNALPTVDLGTGRTAKSLAAGRYGTCAILDEDSVKCWGLASLTGQTNPTGNIGDEPGEMGDHLAPIELGAARKPRAVALGYYDACVALDDRSFRCWGTSTSPLAVNAVSDGASVVSLWHGVAALGIFDDGSVREIIASTVMGPISRTSATDGRALTASGSSRGGCAVLAGGHIACWGSVTQPPAAASTGKALAVVEQGNQCFIAADDSVRCWGGGGTGFPPAVDGVFTVPIGKPVAAISAGNSFACALTTDGDVKCWEFLSASSYATGGTTRTSTSWSFVDLGDR